MGGKSTKLVTLCKGPVVTRSSRNTDILRSTSVVVCHCSTLTNAVVLCNLKRPFHFSLACQDMETKLK